MGIFCSCSVRLKPARAVGARERTRWFSLSPLSVRDAQRSSVCRAISLSFHYHASSLRSIRGGTGRIWPTHSTQSGLQWADRFPGAVDPGAGALAGSLAQLLGLPIDCTAAIDKGGFVRVVDTLDGGSIDVPCSVATWLSPPVPGEDWSSYEISAVQQHLGGFYALASVRSCTGASDDDWIERQRCILAVLYRQAELPTVLLRRPHILDAV